MLYTMHLQPIGTITLYLDSTFISGFNTYITGYDNNHNPIYFIMDKFCYLDQYPDDYGYCHIVSYEMNGVCTPCNIYRALS